MRPIGVALALAATAPALAQEAPEQAPSFEARSAELGRRISDLAGVDAAQPAALEARVEYARFLHEAAKAECAPHLDEAERQLAPVLGATREQLLTLPDGPGDALSLLQSIQNTRGLCASDDGSARAAFESSVATGRRAVEALRGNWDYEEMAIAQFNIAFARRELGDLEGALQSLEQVIAWDLEYGLYADLESDYATLLRWQSGEDPDPAAVRRFVDSYGPARARFRFDWKPHRSQSSMLIESAQLRRGTLQESKTRFEAETTVRRQGEDWIMSSGAREPALVEMAGAGPATDQLQDLMGGIARAMPEMVVAADGTFKELRNLDAFREALDRELGRIVARAAPAGRPAPDPETLATIKATVLNEDLITAIISGQWNLSVGAWLDGEFDHGDWYEAVFEEPIPGISEKPVRLIWTFKVARWLPCAEGGEARCVEVLLRIQPDPGQIREAVAVFVARLIPAADRERMAQAMREVSYRLEMRYRLVTEPDTLLPRSFEERKYVYGASLENGRREVNAGYQRRLETYRYLD